MWVEIQKDRLPALLVGNGRASRITTIPRRVLAEMFFDPVRNLWSENGCVCVHLDFSVKHALVGRAATAAGACAKRCTPLSAATMASKLAARSRCPERLGRVIVAKGFVVQHGGVCCRERHRVLLLLQKEMKCLFGQCET